ncbi:MAG: glycosyltransferase [candidate division WOR-3 bacterium]
MKRLLVISYYTPPLGLSGVMRVTKLCKFLPEFGWQPLILTVKPVAYYAYDLDLLSDLKAARLYRTESLDPNRLLFLMGFKGARLQGLQATGSRRLTCLFPDSKIGWLPFALAKGRRMIQEQYPSAIYATAPPFTSLLVALRLKRYFRLPLVTDFRDPWPTGFVPPPGWQKPLLTRLRKRILQKSDLVLAVNRGTAKAVGPGVMVLENGFDPEEFEAEPVRLDGFSILHVGNLWENETELITFAQALSSIPDARLYLAGNVHPATLSWLRPNPQVKFLGTLPHKEVCRLMKGADVLFYLGKPNQPVGLKLYEYLGARRPILVCGPDIKEAEEIVQECGAGVVSDLNAPGLTAALERLRQGAEHFAQGPRDRFNRRLQARWLAARLDELTGKREP